jgi:lipoyl-dependent peroxiredoxin
MTETPHVLYTAEAHVTGGRAAGHGRTSDGALEVDLRSPRELGGDGGGTNPEQLFAIGYAACFESALGAVARRRHVEIGDVAIDARVMLMPHRDRSFKLGVALAVTLPTPSAPTPTRPGATSTSPSRPTVTPPRSRPSGAGAGRPCARCAPWSPTSARRCCSTTAISPTGPHKLPRVALDRMQG